MEISYAEELSRSGKLVFTIKGVSMRPLFRANQDAIIVVKCDPEKLKNLDIVLFFRMSPDRGLQYVLHRIVGRRPDGMFLIAGDNCNNYDVVAPQDILGVVTSAQRQGKPIKLEGFGYSLYKNLWCRPYRFRFVVLTIKWTLRRIASRILRPFRHRSK